MFFTEGSIHILVVKLKSAIRPLQENRVWGGFDSFSETFFFLFVLFFFFIILLQARLAYKVKTHLTSSSSMTEGKLQPFLHFSHFAGLVSSVNVHFTRPCIFS